MDLPEAITATATVFDNLYFNMNDALGSSAGDIGDNLLSNQRALGHAVGFEVFIKRNLTKRLGGFLTYTLSRSTRMLDGCTFPDAFDRTHVANAALAYNLGPELASGHTARVLHGCSPGHGSAQCHPAAPDHQSESDACVLANRPSSGETMADRSQRLALVRRG